MVAHTQCELARRCCEAQRGDGDFGRRAAELIALARRTADSLGLVRLQRKLEPLEAESSRATAPKSLAGVAEPDAVFAGKWEKRIDEAGTIDSVVASAISRARDLNAQPLFAGTFSILFSDIVESTSLYERLGDLRAQVIIRVHNEIFRQQIAAHRGVEVKAFGDGFMVAFPSARLAVLCAIATQRTFAAYCQSHPDEPLSIRMGLHVGEAISESADYFGKAVNLAARLAALAQGGQILVSSTFRDLTSNAGDFRFESIGEKPLKGLAGTHHIFEVAW